MAKRKRIGLIYTYGESWIAGNYYTQNLIQALNTLPDTEKPRLQILTFDKKDFDALSQLTQYPHLALQPLDIKYNIFQRIINKASRGLLGNNLIEKLPSAQSLDILFLAWEKSYLKHVPLRSKLYWIPDFQEAHLPHFFSEEELQQRKSYQEALVQAKASIVFSSKDALTDFQRLYPHHQNKTFILNFAVTHPVYQDLSIEALRQKYQLPDVYFFSPNQFWAHKNQKVILEALKILKNKQVKCTVAFSGKERDYRNPAYFPSLKEMIQEYQIEDYVRFLGFIDRKEQLKLMSAARAIIQPSLFEGWSTVVEDAKAMNQSIILSNLAVHFEQVSKEEATFFDPHRPAPLADILQKALTQQLPRVQSSYKESVSRFGKSFMNIIQQL
ncbi:MAG: glycosyltransferase [Thermonemataceae bacterium]